MDNEVANGYPYNEKYQPADTTSPKRSNSRATNISNVPAVAGLVIPSISATSINVVLHAEIRTINIRIMKKGITIPFIGGNIFSDRRQAFSEAPVSHTACDSWYGHQSADNNMSRHSTPWLRLFKLAPALHIGSGTVHWRWLPYILTCRGTARGCTAKWMARGDSVHRVVLVSHCQGWSDCSGGISEVENTPAAGFRIPKFSDILVRRHTARGRTKKRMARGDSAHQVGLVCHPQGLSDCSDISKVGTTRHAEFEIPKFWHVLAYRGTTRW